MRRFALHFFQERDPLNERLCRTALAPTKNVGVRIAANGMDTSPFISNVNNISLSGKLPASDAEVPVDVIVEPQVSARLSFNYKT
jgi:hypothetical protein